MSQILERLISIPCPFREDVLSMYSAVMMEMIEKESPSSIESIIDDLYGRCQPLDKPREEFKKILASDTHWISGLLYLAVSEHAKNALGEAGFYEKLTANVLNPERPSSKVRYVPMIGVGTIYRHIEKANDSFTRLTRMEIKESRRGSMVIRRNTLPEYKQELEYFFGAKLAAQILKNDCFFTQQMIHYAPWIVAAVPARIEERSCESHGEEFCEYAVSYKQGFWDKIRKFFTMPKDLAVLHTEMINRDATIRKQTEEIRDEKERSQQLLHHIAPPEQVDAMITNRFRPSRMQATTLFADIVGFSKCSQGEDPEVIAAYVNRHFQNMHQVIKSLRGYEVKYEGDNVMAVFGASFPNDTHAVDAVICGLRMRERAAKVINPEGQKTEIRIGIGTGEITTMLIGASDNYRWDVIGEPINIAARMEQNGRVDMVTISQATKEQVQNYFNITPRSDLISIKGYADPQQIYFVDRLKKVVECKDRIKAHHRFFSSVEKIVESFSQRRLEKFDFEAYDSMEGDPLRSKTIAMISYALAAIKDESLVSRQFLKAAFLQEIGKRHIQQSLLNKIYTHPKEISALKEEIKNKTLAEAPEDVLPILLDYYGKRETIESKIIKAAQIYTGMSCFKFYKKTRPSPEEIVKEMKAQQIGSDIINLMSTTGLI